MSVLALLLSRYAELQRRVEALRSEVDEWKARANGAWHAEQQSFEAHHSQLQAIDTIITTLIQTQRRLLTELEQVNDPEEFSDKGFRLVQHIIKAQRFWDFFRAKLELRFSPRFKESLWVADTVAWNCYRPVVEQAADDGILLKAALREPPLTYLAAELSPVTYVRGKTLFFEGRDKLFDLATNGTLPIPVIELPWDQVENLWELLSIPHEVGHDLMADFKLEMDLLGNLDTARLPSGAKLPRIAEWQAWLKEVFADLVALQLAGPAFTECLLHQLFLPENVVMTPNPQGPHPTHYVRILMNVAYIRTLVPKQQHLLGQADRIEARWKELYGAPSEFIEYGQDYPHVFKALMDTPMPSLQGKTVRALIPYTATHDARIRAACQYLCTGQGVPQPRSLEPRHCVSAARLAVTETALLLQGLNVDPQHRRARLAASLHQINQRTVALVRDNALPGVRAGAMSTPRRQFLARFAQML